MKRWEAVDLFFLAKSSASDTNHKGIVDYALVKEMKAVDLFFLAKSSALFTQITKVESKSMHLSKRWKQ